MQKPVKPETPELAKGAAMRANIVTFLAVLALLAASGYVVAKEEGEEVSILEQGDFPKLADEVHGLDSGRAEAERKALAQWNEEMVVYETLSPKRGRKKSEQNAMEAAEAEIVTGNEPIDTSKAEKPKSK